MDHNKIDLNKISKLMAELEVAVANYKRSPNMSSQSKYNKALKDYYVEYKSAFGVSPRGFEEFDKNEKDDDLELGER